jgi:hypothetical protein
VRCRGDIAAIATPLPRDRRYGRAIAGIAFRRRAGDRHWDKIDM